MRLVLPAALVLVHALFVPLACARPQDWADILLLEESARDPIPVISYFEPELDRRYAYAIQQSYIEKQRARRRTERIVAFVAGPADRYMRRQYSLPEQGLAAAALLTSRRLRPGALLLRQGLTAPVIGLGLGFVLKTAPTQPVQTLAALSPLVARIVPVVVYADLGFGREARSSELDLIAANLGMRAAIIGAEQPAGLDTGRIVASLMRAGRGLNWVRAEAVPGGQWRALAQLISEVRSQGYRLEPGQVLVTALLGRLVPALPGPYVADFQAAGRVEFEVR